MNAFVLAGASSGVGKTTIASGLMAALGKYGEVAPFKAGPDYIDPMYHRAVLDGVHSYNLDTVLCGPRTVQHLFSSRLAPGSIAIVEGVMGMHDGVSSIPGLPPDSGSSAELASLLNIPVVLVVNGNGMARSLAALVKGYADFGNAEIAGVIINRVKSGRAYEIQKKAIEEEAGIAVLGCLPEASGLSLGSRHLGLLQPEEVPGFFEWRDRLADELALHVDLDSLLRLTECGDVPAGEDPFSGLEGRYEGLTIGVAFDKAFRFYYQDNLDLLERLGGRLAYFSPLSDGGLPKGVDALYFGGGYPEVLAAELGKNTAIMRSVKDALENGMPCYAECGGMVYLNEKMEGVDGLIHNGVGFFPGKVKLNKRLINFGYCEVSVSGVGKARAHEFHRTSLDGSEGSFYSVSQRGGRRPGGLTKKATLAGYPHFHFYSAPDGPKLLLKALDFVGGRG